MPRKAANNVNKSELIRETYRLNPTAGPTEIARMIAKAHGVEVSAAMVSTVLSKDRSTGGAPVRRGRPPVAAQTAPAAPAPVFQATAAPAAGQMVGGIPLDLLMRVKKLSDEIGGVNNTRAALDTLSQILA